MKVLDKLDALFRRELTGLLAEGFDFGIHHQSPGAKFSTQMVPVMPGTRVRLRRPEHKPHEPSIHDFGALERNTWMAGTSPTMTACASKIQPISRP